MAQSKSDWQIVENQAKFASKEFSASIDMRFPNKGMHDVKYRGTPIEDLATLQISPQPPTPKDGETIVESYARGDDLIINYAQTPARTSQPQIDWSYVNTGSAVGLQATIAVKTSLLDSDPTVQSRSILGKGELLRRADNGADEWESISDDVTIKDGASVFLFRPAEADWSYAEVIFPSDFQGADIRSGKEGMEIGLSLFPEFLEKGVIRKGRIQSLFMPRNDDTKIAIEAHATLANSAAPLTT